jgi:ABC-type phosphate transport system substrate-binding protein
MRTSGRRWTGITAVVLVITSAACTALLDRDATQCQADGDCVHFGSHPYCRGGVCVSSGLGPANCFYGTPQQPQDFMNQCSTAQCVPFDNCQRLGMCGPDSSEPDAALVPPPTLDAGSSSPATADGGDGGITLASCVDPSNGRSQVVYLTGSSNFPPLLAKLAPLIIATGFTPVYKVSNSCTGVKAVFGSGADLMMSDPAPGPSAKYATYFSADGTSTPCTLGPNGAQVDIGESDIFSTTCDGIGAPGGTIGEYLGPIQAMAFVVPGKSQETAITAEAAREVFGMGGGTATPWTNPSLYFVRNANTGTQQQIGHAIGVPANQFWGVDRGSAANVDALMKVISDPTLAEQAIGIISADYYDNDRANLIALAFQADGQDCAYLPDSTSYKKDKQNVRDGHYPVWGPLHFFATVSNGVPVSPGAQAFASVVSVPNVPQALLDAFIAASLVPACAMSVQRTAELGPLSAYTAPFQCGCYFEASPAVNGAAPAGCASCTTANDCTDPRRPACNLGYCEVQ